MFPVMLSSSDLLLYHCHLVLNHREFVSCVRCIRILSPQEVQQMSLDGDLDKSFLPSKACNSSDGKNVWSEDNDLVNNLLSLSYNNSPQNMQLPNTKS